MQRNLQLTPTLTVSDQLTVNDVVTLAQRGVKTIFCNRPDNEEPGQPPAASLRAAAEVAGLAFVHQAVSFSTLQAHDGAAFAEHLARAQGPVHAYCRTGRRSVALWAMANAKAMGTHAVIDAAMRVGEDMRGLAPMLAEIESK
jgi:sulfide:quinone oxidoreductase